MQKWKVIVTQSCLTLCDPMDCSLPGSSVHGILQARILVWVAIPFSRGSSWPRDRTQVSYIAGRFFTIWATRVAGSPHHSLHWGHVGTKASRHSPGSGGPSWAYEPRERGTSPRRPAPYLQERFFLFEMLADHGGDMVRLGVGAQLVGPSAPVLFPFVLLLQALQDAADLRWDRGWV